MPGFKLAFSRNPGNLQFPCSQLHTQQARRTRYFPQNHSRLYSPERRVKACVSVLVVRDEHPIGAGCRTHRKLNMRSSYSGQVQACPSPIKLLSQWGVTRLLPLYLRKSAQYIFRTDSRLATLGKQPCAEHIAAGLRRRI